ncbi:MAG: AIR synthase related protein [Desulfobacterales bacterium]|nr:AIR synthase related protein [Desulfobacterales bacterium]
MDPIFFPGGNIGELAVYGTVNDLAMCGATPLYLSAALIIEEGFPIEQLETIIAAMGQAAERAGVSVVTGDTKVVPKGTVDKIFINTSGIGVIPDRRGRRRATRPGPATAVILSGSIADHGVSVMARRARAFVRDLGSKRHRTPQPHGGGRCVPPAAGSTCCGTPPGAGWARRSTKLPRNPRSAIRIREDRIPVKPEVAGALRTAGLRSALPGQRGQAHRLRGARRRRGGARRRCGRTAAAAMRSSSAKWSPDHPGQGLHADPHRRHPHRGHAGGGAAAADLLKWEAEGGSGSGKMRQKRSSKGGNG